MLQNIFIEFEDLSTSSSENREHIHKQKYQKNTTHRKTNSLLSSLKI